MRNVLQYKCIASSCLQYPMYALIIVIMCFCSRIKIRFLTDKCILWKFKFNVYKSCVKQITKAEAEMEALQHQYTEIREYIYMYREKPNIGKRQLRGLKKKARRLEKVIRSKKHEVDHLKLQVSQFILFKYGIKIMQILQNWLKRLENQHLHRI